MIEQIMIGVCGVAAVFLSQDERARVRRYACLFGLAAQPAWFYATYKAQQWGVFALSILYAFAWARGFVTQWLWRRA